MRKLSPAMQRAMTRLADHGSVSSRDVKLSTALALRDRELVSTVHHHASRTWTLIPWAGKPLVFEAEWEAIKDAAATEATKRVTPAQAHALEVIEREESATFADGVTFDTAESMTELGLATLLLPRPTGYGDSWGLIAWTGEPKMMGTPSGRLLPMPTTPQNHGVANEQPPGDDPDMVEISTVGVSDDGRPVRVRLRVEATPTRVDGLVITNTVGDDAAHSPYTLTHRRTGAYVTIHMTVREAMETADALGWCGSWTGEPAPGAAGLADPLPGGVELYAGIRSVALKKTRARRRA